MWLIINEKNEPIRLSIARKPSCELLQRMDALRITRFSRFQCTSRVAIGKKSATYFLADSSGLELNILDQLKNEIYLIFFLVDCCHLILIFPL